MGSKAYSSTTTQDNRVQVDSTGGGKFVAPAAVSSDPGSIAFSAGDFAQVNMSGATFRMGMSGSEVASLIGQQASIASQNLATVAESSKSAMAAAAGQPEWSKYIPLAIGAVVLVAIWGRKGRKAA